MDKDRRLLRVDCKEKEGLLFGNRASRKGKKLTDINSVDFSFDQDGSTFTTKDIDGLSQGHVFEGQSFILLVFLESNLAGYMDAYEAYN